MNAPERLLCPTCVSVPLDRRCGINKIQVDLCPRCQGIWFDWAEVYMFTDSVAEFERLLRDAAKASSPTSRLCPRCNKPLREGLVGSKRVGVDQCGSCAGLWLESSELEALLSMLPKKPAG